MTNYQNELEKLIEAQNGKKQKLLLHSCCGPCSTYCLEYLTKYFDVSVYYYNPNIMPREEYILRLEEQKKVISTVPFSGDVKIVEGEYQPREYLQFVRGLEAEPEGGARCEKCFLLRLDKTAKAAKEAGFDFFGTTLTVSPHKDAEKINSIGQAVAEKYGIAFLPSDFKKKNGYLRSIQLSKEYGIYRQNYCGCRFALTKGENDV